MNLSSWMKNLDGSKKILSFNIPATHDCAAQYVQHSRLCKCQNTSISQQLENGIRLLDVRVAPKRNRLIVVHSTAKTFNDSQKKSKTDFADLLESCYAFLKSNPSECVILRFKNDSPDLFDKKCSKLLFEKYISQNEELWFLENRVPTLDEVRGKIFLMRRCFAKSNSEYSSKLGLDLSKWIDQSEIVPDSLLLETKSFDNAQILIHDRYRYTAEKRWKLCLEPFFSKRKAFDGTYILCYLSTSGSMSCPEENSNYINPKFLNLKLSKENYYGAIYFDFANEALAKKVIDLNF